MDVPGELLGLLLVSLLAAIFLWRYEVRRRRTVGFAKASQSTRYGNLAEQFAPWMARWPFRPEWFRFIGRPVDGIQFEADALYIVEIKSAGADLSKEQREIRRLVEEGRVGWMTFYVNETRAPDVVRPWERRR